MKKKDKRPIYEPPRAIDLSVGNASGELKPLGACWSGTYPWHECKIGTQVAGGTDCAPVGMNEQYPKCQVGSQALISCIVGTEAG